MEVAISLDEGGKGKTGVGVDENDRPRLSQSRLGRRGQRCKECVHGSQAEATFSLGENEFFASLSSASSSSTRAF